MRPSRVLLAHFLVLGLILVGLAMSPDASGDVVAISVTTDRTDYVDGMNVTALGSIDWINPPGGNPDNALAEWFDASWSLLWSEWVPAVRVGPFPANATAVWLPPGPGDYFVNVTSNDTKNSPTTTFTGSASFRVWDASTYVIATGLAVTTDKSAYDLAETAFAFADFTANASWVNGNLALLEEVEFRWFDPVGALVRGPTVVPVTLGTAQDSWSPSVPGNGFRVNVTYLGNDTVSNETTFNVLPPANPVPNVGNGQTVTLDVASSPWRACGDILVSAGGTLIVEAGVTVTFCLDSRLTVQGVLTAVGTTTSAITFTSLEAPPSPGDWRGIWFDGSVGSRIEESFVEYAQDAIVILSANPDIVRVRARFGSGTGVNATSFTGSLVDLTVVAYDTGVWLVDSTSTIQRGSVGGSAVDGIRVEGGSAQILDTEISGSVRDGVVFDGASGLLSNVTVTANGLAGVRAGSLSDLVFEDVNVSGGSIGVSLVDSALTAQRSSLFASSFLAVDMDGSVADLTNTTILSAAGAQDFLLLDSTATVRNGVFVDNATKRSIDDPSRLFIENFLAVHVVNAGAGLAGASVEVAVNGSPTVSRATDATGYAEWIALEDRWYNGTTETKNNVTVTVGASGFTFDQNPRVVDMATSHQEDFLASPTNGVIPGGDGLPLGIILAVVLVAGAAGAGVFAYRRRSKDEEDEPEGAGAVTEYGPLATPETAGPDDGEAVAEVTPTEDLPVAESVEAVAPSAAEAAVAVGGVKRPTGGTCYAVHGDKSDAAIRWFADAVRRGGSPGVCVTRLHPGAARTRFRLEGVPIFWLSRTMGEDSLNPTNLGAIVDLVDSRTADKPGTYVLLDGLEYLYTQNDFPKVAKFVQALTDVVAQRRAILILPLNPTSFDEEQLAILSRDLVTWP